MSKYIIELDENTKKVVAISLEDGIMWTYEMEVDDLEELCDDYIRKEYRELPTEAYKRGYDYGLLKGKHDAEQDMYDKGYQKGFEEGKDAIHKGCEGCKYEGTIGMPPCVHCSNNFPNQWSLSDGEIEIGDEVRSTYGGRVMEDFTPWVVTLVTSETCYGFDADGNPRNNPNTMVQKTGRHFDIDKILEGMNE